MDKNQLEFEKAKFAYKEKIVTGILSALTMLFVMGTVLGCVYFVVDGYVALSKEDAKSLDSLSKIVEALGLAQITSYIIGALGLAYGVVQGRTVKKLRATNV